MTATASAITITTPRCGAAAMIQRSPTNTSAGAKAGARPKQSAAPNNRSAKKFGEVGSIMPDLFQKNLVALRCDAKRRGVLVSRIRLDLPSRRRLWQEHRA